MFEVEELKYTPRCYNKILGDLREALIKYFVETLQEDLKEADFWFERIEDIIKSESDDYTCFQVRIDEDVIGFMIIINLNNQFALIRHFFIITTVDQEEVAYTLLKETFDILKHKYKINKFQNAAFTFPEDYLAKPLKRLGYSILTRHNMTLSLNAFEKKYELPSEYYFAIFDKEDLHKIAELAVQVFKNHPDGTFWDEVNTIPLYLEHLETIWTSYLLKGCSFVVKNARDQIIGFCLIEKAEDEEEVIIQNIAINKQDQGKGIGKALLSKVIETTCEKGYNKAILTVTEGIPAQQLYDNFGFKKYTSFNIITNQ